MKRKPLIGVGMTSLTAFVRNEDGAVAVELALTGAVFMLMLCAILEIAILLFAQNSVQAAAGELALRGRANTDPAVIVEQWRSSDSAALMANTMSVEHHCYATLDALIADGPETSCGSAKLVQWNARLDWTVITPLVSWILPDDFGLTASGVSYR